MDTVTNNNQPSEGALSFFIWLLFCKECPSLLFYFFFPTLFVRRKKTAKAPLYDRYITGKNKVDIDIYKEKKKKERNRIS
jgi:hypothetical protein